MIMPALLFLIIVLGWALPADAACSGSSPTRTAASASQTDVQACVTAAASTGDTIHVPAGSATWATPIDISTKDLIIVGAGNGSDPASNTVITGSTSTCFSIAVGSDVSSASQISYFRFINCNTNTRGLNGAKAFRIHHNYFQSAADQDQDIDGGSNTPPQGLLDHNTFERMRFVVRGTIWLLSENNYQHQIWALDPNFGGVGVYIEDNIFNPTNHPGPLDCNNGGRLVMRFNTIHVTNTYTTEIHGVQGLNRACQRWEVYGNTLTQDGSPSTLTAFMRGGSGFWWGNTMNAGWGTSDAKLKVERATESKSPFGFCDGTWIIDGNIDTGYPCRDQIGRSKDDSLYTGNYNGTTGSGSWPTQTLTPVYGWNNLQSSTQIGFTPVESATYDAENRDWYKFSSATGSPQTVGVRVDTLANRPAGCTAGVGYWATDQGSWNTSTSNPQGTQLNGADGVLYKCTGNAWTTLYIPYTYPHPLQGGTPDIIGPGTPTGLRVSKAMEVQ